MKSKFILGLAMACATAMPVSAQVATEAETDSTVTQATPAEMVQVAYRKVAKENAMGGVSVVDVQDLLKKNYITYSLDNMQGYVGGWNGNSLWGQDGSANTTGYLVLVDGVPREANNVLPSEIDNITFMKGAHAVMLYGSKAAKGVIYITTKRGSTDERQIDVRVDGHLYVPKIFPKYLGAAEYMTLYNEALKNDGLSANFTDEQIYRTASGENPYRYPDFDFYSSEYLKKMYTGYDVTAEFQGGNDRARFYTNIGFNTASSLLDFGEAEDNNTNRLNVRGNIDLKLSDFINAKIDANATFYTQRSDNSSYWRQASTLRPNRVAPLIPVSYIDPNALDALTAMETNSNLIDGKYFLSGTSIDQTNAVADAYAAGYGKWQSRSFQFSTNLDFDLGMLTKGLSFSTMFALDHATSYSISYNNTYAVYEPTWSSYNGQDVITSLTKHNIDKKSGVQNISGSNDQFTIAFNGMFAYQRKFDDHNIDLRVVAAGHQVTKSAEYHRTSSANLGFMAAYDFADKYFLEVGGTQIHSAKLAEGHRQEFSPSASIGWKLSNESFLDGSMFDNLMLSASASILNTDLDISDYYMYQATYDQADGAWWGWREGVSEHSTNVKRGGNDGLTFVKRKEFALNLNAQMLDRSLTADASFFINKTEGLVIEPSTIYPSYFQTYYPDASFIPYANYNDDKRWGFDFAVNYSKEFGDLGVDLGVTGTYYKTEILKRDENYEEQYRYRVGHDLDGVWGLKCIGYFKDEADIANSPQQTFAEVRPGDLKYADQNGDGVIDNKDEVFLGRGGWYGAPFTLGVNLTLRYKGFTLFALGTGGFGSYGVKNNAYYWVYGDGKYSEVVRDRWTENTADQAKYPRLTTQSGSNNFRTSDYWEYNTNRFNLSKVQLTYTLPQNIIDGTFVKDASVYVSGADLLTFAEEKEYMEMNIGSAPQNRTYMLGLKVTF